ncbi:PAS domain S-box protein [Aporhodopirellula aestuarii]|uniref:histidine kinase n=1 Tax=Aporhodopirellula aestuarii TaxID=2950107 RepID=A0ABT0U9R0_9BACT|nr:PAS domain S-box protein [Aporhodopirellula aestuarii]MCM2373419.1 PAS domain S-box protein [Aporhodopirellula aestuarii]
MSSSKNHSASVLQKLEEHYRSIHIRTDRMFAVLMILQWLGGIAVALTVSPHTWIGAKSELHPHVMMAVLGGGVLAAMPVVMAIFRPGLLSTRIVIACSQVLFSSLLIHLSGGRIETHFHVFGSLAFLAAYRDLRVLGPATLIVAVDHFVRGVWWPESVFGIATASQWRWLEHAAWVVFENTFLLIIIRQSAQEMLSMAYQATRLNEALDKAEAGERLFREGFDQTAMGMAVKNLDGSYRLVNDRYCQITGYSREELYTKRFQDITHPEDIPLHAAAMPRLSSGEQSNFQIDKRYLRKDGHEVWVRLTLSLVRDSFGRPDHLIAAVQDISEERLAQEQIAKLSLVASKARHSVIIAGPDGRIQWVNDGFTNLTGYTPEEALGQMPSELLQGPDTDSETTTLIGERLRAHQTVSVEILNYHKSGEAYWISLEIDPVFNEAGELCQYIATQADISERRLRATHLERATREAESANKAKSQFLANMSHEIRTPLNGILGFTEVLLRDRDRVTDEEMDEHLNTIRRSGKHLLTLINDVLDISKIEADQLKVEAVPYSPHQVLSDTVSVLRVVAREKGIGLDYRWDSTIPNTILTDPYRLKQLLLNLVGNAIKFTNQGAVVIVARIEETGALSELVVEVRDTGIGIPQEKLDAVFDPFVQADDTVTRRFGGTGLGLAISRKIAEALGGSLTARSIVGQGSTFVVRVATGDLSNVGSYEPSAHLPGADVKTSSTAPCDLNGLTVLIVDDGDINRRLTRLLLERGGATVRLAENGQVAVDIASQTQFDVILMDMQMPVLDGYSATTKLRERGFKGPVIALTAHAMKGDREKCEAAGCTGYLSKPVDADQLYEVISESCKTTVSQGQSPEPIRSKLPTDDAEIREIVEEFLDTFEYKFGEMKRAWDAGDMNELANLAHWLKGAAGTVGFGCFTEPASNLEGAAKERIYTQVGDPLKNILELKQRIVL